MRYSSRSAEDVNGVEGSDDVMASRMPSRYLLWSAPIIPLGSILHAISYVLLRDIFPKLAFE